ncbi:MAG: hypothetical protein ACFE7R_08680 [Candidatus Hodarchaeota archaeon]
MSEDQPLVVDIESRNNLYTTISASDLVIIGAFHKLSSFDSPWIELLYKAAEELADMARQTGFIFARCWAADDDPGYILWEMANLTGTPSFILFKNGEVKDSFNVGLYEASEVKYRFFSWILEAAVEKETQSK